MGSPILIVQICMGKSIRIQRVKFAIVVYRVEKEYSTVKKQLTTEVDSKKTTIGNLSKELEIHQKNFIELKEELSKVLIVLSITFIIFAASKGDFKRLTYWRSLILVVSQFNVLHLMSLKVNIYYHRGYY